MKIKSIELVGIKNIIKPVKVQFLNKTNHSIKDESTIKLIYGANGSGKTAIIEALSLYRDLIVKSSILVDTTDLIEISRLYNIKTNGIRISVEFYAEKKSFIHTIEVIKTNEENFKITYEELTKMNGSGVGKTLYLYENGILECSDLYSNRNNGVIEEAISNKLGERSIIHILVNQFVIPSLKNKKYKDLSHVHKKFNMYEVLLIYVYFTYTIIVSEPKDSKVKNLLKFDFINGVHYKSGNYFELNNESFTADLDTVSKDYLREYEKNILKLTKYLKIFKPNLKKIKLVRNMKGNTIEIDKVLVYDYGSVSISNESVGIKKAVEFFNVFSNKKNMSSRLIIIDELDAHFHDYLLTKLLEYVRDYANIQLIATTHNILNMEAVKKCKHSISILTLDNDVLDWKNSGNYSPTSLYSNNSLKGIDFGYNALDFMQTFDSSDKKS